MKFGEKNDRFVQAFDKAVAKGGFPHPGHALMTVLTLVGRAFLLGSLWLYFFRNEPFSLANPVYCLSLGYAVSAILCFFQFLPEHSIFTRNGKTLMDNLRYYSEEGEEEYYRLWSQSIAPGAHLRVHIIFAPWAASALYLLLHWTVVG